MENLGDRMKRYENVCRYGLTRRVPVIIRVDGRSFHSYAKRADKPFDEDLTSAMSFSARKTAEDMQGFKVAYTQSDEASFLLTDYEDIMTEPWFGYNLQKITTSAASSMTAYFNSFIEYNKEDFIEKFDSLARFDARAFNIPKEEVANYFLWRQKDWERNSLSMYCRAFFSHSELQGKNRDEMHEMLYSIGKNWTNDVHDKFKNGTFIYSDESRMEYKSNVLPNFESSNKFISRFI